MSRRSSGRSAGSLTSVPAPRTFPTPDRPAGTLRVGTSGFAYPGWIPRFYPAGLRGEGFLRHYASRLDAVELNNTFYRQPTESAVDGWLRAVPEPFRFVVKAQRGGSFRAWQAAATDTPPLDWLTDPYRRFGAALGAVLVRVPDSVRRNGERDDERLGRFLAAWPPDLPLAMEFQDPSWEVDEVLGALREAGAAWVVTELDEDERPPSIHVTGGLLYLRLRCGAYDQAGIDAWADRLVPFVEAGLDAFAFFRHDDVGRGPEFALALGAAVGERLGRGRD